MGETAQRWGHTGHEGGDTGHEVGDTGHERWKRRSPWRAVRARVSGWETAWDVSERLPELGRSERDVI